MQTRSYRRDIVIFFFLAALVLVFWRPAGATYTPPTLPQASVNTNYPTLASGHTVRSVKASCTNVANCYTSLQSAIDAANFGDEVVIDAGLVLNGPIILKNKTGSGWIIIRSSKLGNLPANNRVGPANTGNMAKIVSQGSNQPALETQASAHGYWVAGLEFAKASPTAVVDTLVLAGDGSAAQNSLSLVPHDLVFDRIYVHGDPISDLKRGIALNSASTAVINSYISDVHVVGVDAQAIAGWNGSGPFKIYNNYLEAAAENFLFGGSDPAIPNLVPSDMDFEYNYLYKPRSWRVGDPSYAGKHWAVKNIFELKNARRMLIQNNIFDGTWADGQTGYAILFTVRDSNGTCTWCVVSDVTFQNNIIRHAAAGFQILGHDNVGGPSGLTQRLKISNNLWYDINGPAWGGNGWWNLIEAGTSDPGPSDVELSHNTVDQTGNAVYPSPYISPNFITKPNFVIRDNIIVHNSYGVIGAGSGVGNSTLDSYFPGVIFTKNALIGGPSNSYSKYPGNYFPANWGAVVSNEPNGDYHVFTTSLYHNVATDGTDLGANITEINNATSSVINGVTTASTLVGDINRDCIVNSIDASLVNSNWLTTNPTTDLNHDGLVNSLDWSIVNANWFFVC